MGFIATFVNYIRILWTLMFHSTKGNGISDKANLWHLVVQKLNYFYMVKGIFNSIGIYQPFKMQGSGRHGFESFRRTLFVFIMGTVSVLTSFAQTPLDETNVYNRIMERQHEEGYTEGTPWDNDHIYFNQVEFDGIGPGRFKGAGCFAFMLDMMEYASNYKYPIRRIYGTYENLPKIRVGDGVRLNNNGHSVVVLEVHSDGHTVKVAEGNFNSSVHWGRIIDLADPNNGFYYLATFWPEQEPEFEMGDVNHDGRVSVTDVMMTVNRILNNEVSNFDESLADMNEDGKINVTDIMLMVNTILQ